MRGLGDNLYQRAFVQNVGPCWIDTPWPELYADLPNVQVGFTGTTLRTQAKNAARQPHGWTKPIPAGARIINSWYGTEGALTALRRIFRVEPTWNLPALPAPLPDERIAVVRPVTVRAEWRNEARNPQPEYVAQAAEELRRRGYTVVSVADLEDGAEWALDPLPRADHTFHHGELHVRELLGLVAQAVVCVGPIGWLLPAAISAGVPYFGICGGHGAHNAPEKLTDTSMDLTKIGWAIPENFCRCAEMGHACDKRIGRFADKFSAWLEGLRL